MDSQNKFDLFISSLPTIAWFSSFFLKITVLKVFLFSQGRVDDLQTELGQLKERENKLLEDKEVIENQNKEEYMALKQERDSKVASLSGSLSLMHQSRTHLIVTSHIIISTAFYLLFLGYSYS